MPQIFYRTLWSGRTRALDLARPPGETPVLEVKRQIADAEGVPSPDRLRLVHAGRELDDSARVPGSRSQRPDIAGKNCAWLTKIDTTTGSYTCGQLLDLGYDCSGCKQCKISVGESGNETIESSGLDMARKYMWPCLSLSATTSSTFSPPSSCP